LRYRTFKVKNSVTGLQTFQFLAAIFKLLHSRQTRSGYGFKSLEMFLTSAVSLTLLTLALLDTRSKFNYVVIIVTVIRKHPVWISTRTSIKHLTL